MSDFPFLSYFLSDNVQLKISISRTAATMCIQSVSDIYYCGSKKIPKKIARRSKSIAGVTVHQIAVAFAPTTWTRDFVVFLQVLQRPWFERRDSVLRRTSFGFSFSWTRLASTAVRTEGGGRACVYLIEVCLVCISLTSWASTILWVKWRVGAEYTTSLWINLFVCASFLTY